VFFFLSADGVRPPFAAVTMARLRKAHHGAVGKMVL